MPNQKPKVATQPKVAKKPSVGAVNPGAFYKARPVWRVRSMKVAAPHGWHEISRTQMLQVIERLKNFETMAWKEILGRQNHFIPVSDLIGSARSCLEEQWQGADEVLSLRFCL